MGANGCTGTLHFLSSVLTSEDGMGAAVGLGPFHLTLTAECFTERRQIRPATAVERFFPY
jgi:hypothetical protein